MTGGCSHIGRWAVALSVVALAGLGRAGAPPPAYAAEAPSTSYVRREIPARRCASVPVVDGRLAEPAWSGAPAAEVFVDRQTGSTGVDQTTAHVLYDEQSIYVAFRCRDSRPAEILARETVRDTLYQTGPTEDCVEVCLDTFMTCRPGDMSRFALNAIGTRSAQVGGGRARKVEWSGDWEGAVTRTDEGWDAEMRIPWRILNYPSARGAATMGINFGRYQHRTRLETVWSNTGPQGFHELEGRWTGVQVPRGEFRPTLSLLPYVLPTLGGSAARMGLDARYTATPELTAVAALNPDFSTVEGAVEGIAFTRGERLVQERRPFFLEGASYFNPVGATYVGSFFYPQRIRNFDLGTKLYGKVSGSGDVGILHAQDLDGRSDLAASYRHRFSPTAQVGVLLSQRTGAGADNTAALLSQRTRWGKLMLDACLGATIGRGAGGSAKSFAVSYLDKVMNYTFAAVDLGDHLHAANGYMPFVGYRGALLQVQGGTEWRTGTLRGYEVSLLPFFLLHTDGRPLQRGIEASFGLRTRSDWGAVLEVVQTKWDDQKDATLGFTVVQNVSNRFQQWGLTFRTGTMADRSCTFIGPRVSVRVARGLEMSYFGSVQSFAGTTQQHVASMRFEMSPTRSIGGRVVVQNGRTNWYASFSNSGGRGLETFLVLGDPNAQRFDRRITLKCVFPI